MFGFHFLVYLGMLTLIVSVTGAEQFMPEQPINVIFTCEWAFSALVTLNG